MAAPEHRPYEEDLAAYLLGALSPAEVGEFESHLAGCASCQVEERWLRGAVETLSSSVEQIEPPPELRKRLLGTIRAEASADRGADRARKPRLRWNLLLRPATALAAVAILAAGLAGYLISDDGTAPTASTVAARGTAAAPGAGGSVWRSGDAAVLRVTGLPPQRRGHVYEVWLARDEGTVEPSSLFVVRPDGTGSAAIPGGLEGVQAVMVTLEPESGSSKPSTAPVLRAPL
jgi:anti-sigma-K factor RskA